MLDHSTYLFHSTLSVLFIMYEVEVGSVISNKNIWGGGHAWVWSTHIKYGWSSALSGNAFLTMSKMHALHEEMVSVLLAKEDICHISTTCYAPIKTGDKELLYLSIVFITLSLSLSLSFSRKHTHKHFSSLFR